MKNLLISFCFLVVLGASAYFSVAGGGFAGMASNFMTFFGLVLAPLAGIVMLVAFALSMKADKGDAETIEKAKEVVEARTPGAYTMIHLGMLACLGVSVALGYWFTAICYGTALFSRSATRYLFSDAARAAITTKD